MNKSLLRYTRAYKDDSIIESINMPGSISKLNLENLV
jgi:hypothetical protein